MYPYVIPFSGAALARDPELSAHTVYAERHVAGTNVTWKQPVKILPIDPAVRAAILRIEQDFEAALNTLQRQGAHLPSRMRSLVWILCSLPVMAGLGFPIADEADVRTELEGRLPQARRTSVQADVANA
jgi:hypothetical protein